MFRLVTLAALATIAAAQFQLSQQCTAALAAVATNPDAAACLSTSSLVPIITQIASGTSNTSIVAPVNNWLTNLCAGPSCSNDTLAAVVQGLTQGCSKELSLLGFSSDLTPTITSLIQQYYPTARKVVCLKDGNTNCITQTLTNVQTVSGDLTNAQTILQAFGGGLDNFPTNITCTDCAKAAYNAILTDVPSLKPAASGFFTDKCGATFTDGQTPSNIAQSASTATGTAPPANNAALGLHGALSSGVAAGLAVSGLVAVSTIFTLLA